MLFKIALIAIVVCGLLFLIKHKKGQANGPTPLPILSKDRRFGIRTPENEKKLIAWNEKNFRRNPSFIYPGPRGEDWQAQRLRYSLFTPEQFATIPLRHRISIRNKRNRSSEKDSCSLCGQGSATHVRRYNIRQPGVELCDECFKRFEKDKAEGWSAPTDFGRASEAVLWTLQQRIAMNLVDGTITETIARAEMKEAVDVVRQEMNEAKALEEKRNSNHDEEAERAEMSRIVRDFYK